MVPLTITLCTTVGFLIALRSNRILFFGSIFLTIALTSFSFVDAIVIVQDGKLVYEKYFNGMRPESQHILFSVSKSILGLIFGILEEDKVLDTRSMVSKYVPEICGTAYENATLRHCLDMQVGVYFDEDYLATSGPIVDYRYAANWNQTPDSKKHLGLHSFLKTLKLNNH